MMKADDRPHIKPGPVKYTKGYGIRVFIRKLINFITMLVIGVVVAGSIYVFAKQPAKVSDGYQTAPQVHRLLKPGDEVVVISGENYNMFTPLKRFLIEHETHYAKVIAGPYGQILQSQGQQKVKDGENTHMINIEEIGHEYLDEEYVVREIDSNGDFLDEGYDTIINKNNILGLKEFDKNW